MSFFADRIVYNMSDPIWNLIHVDPYQKSAGSIAKVIPFWENSYNE